MDHNTGYKMDRTGDSMLLSIIAKMEYWKWINMDCILF